MKSFTEPIQPESFYHLYNRGINGCNLFLAEHHYRHFIEKYASQTEKILTTYSYSLLLNHFHFLVKIKSEDEIRSSFSHKANKSVEQIISSQFAHLFNGYAQYFNLTTQRSGKLFELPFRRKSVNSNDYLTRLIYYIHTNSQKHGFVKDFQDYKYSSFLSFLSESPTKLPREEVLKWFGGKEEFLKFHQQAFDLCEIEDYTIDI